jgi:hypothetical protein
VSHDFMLLAAEAEIHCPNDRLERTTRVIGDGATIRAALTNRGDLSLMSF